MRFLCKGGAGYHPVWYGACDGPLIEREHVESSARAYLRNQKHWLKRIDVIEPQNNTLAKPAGNGFNSPR